MTDRRDDCAGTVVGSSFWRSARNSEATFIADTIALTGFDAVDAAQTYVVCRKGHRARRVDQHAWAHRHLVALGVMSDPDARQ